MQRVSTNAPRRAGDYVAAILSKQRAETLSSVLYPDDRTYEGKELRLKQQHFFVSATIQVRRGKGPTRAGAFKARRRLGERMWRAAGKTARAAAGGGMGGIVRVGIFSKSADAARPSSRQHGVSWTCSGRQRRVGNRLECGLAVVLLF